MLSILATRPTPATALSACRRCGIDHTPNHMTAGDRKYYCKDCRIPAAQLGWCEPHGKDSRTRELINA